MYARSVQLAAIMLVATIHSSICYADYTVAQAAAFGQQWVRDHDFTLMAISASHYLDTPTYPSISPAQFYGAGLNTGMAAWWPTAKDMNDQGIAWHALNLATQLDAATMNDLTTNWFPYRSNLTGITFKDEITIQQIPGVSDVVQWVRAQRTAGQIPGDTLLYIGSLDARFGPGGPAGYDNYIDQIVTQIRPEVLMYHWHPFYDPASIPAADGLNTYYFNMMELRRKAKQYDLPYFAWLQSFWLDTTAVPNAVWRRPPSESEMRFQAFTHLTAGYKGLNYYAWDEVNSDTSGDGVPDMYGIVDAHEQPTILYNRVASLTPEVARLGSVLKYLDSTAVAYVSSGAFLDNPPEAPDGSTVMAEWTPGTGSALIDNIAVLFPSPPVMGQDGLIGFFEDDDGQTYFMLTNTWHDSDLTAQQAELSFVIDFDPSVNSILRLNRLTGQTEVLDLFQAADALGNNTFDRLVLTLPGGTGDLFKFNSGPFVPEPSAATIGLVGALGALGFRRRVTQ